MKYFDGFGGGGTDYLSSNKKLEKASQEKNQTDIITNEYNEKINTTLSQRVNKKMNDLFKTKANQLSESSNNEAKQMKEKTHIKTAELSNENELNIAETQLATMFGKLKNFQNLKPRDNDIENIHTLSVASVMDDYDEYEEHELIGMSA